MAETTFPQLSIIVAIARNGIIGCTNEEGRGALPWHLPEDLKHFKETTNGHPIIMGRKTWESLGRPLPNRRNIVISRQTDYLATGAEVFTSLPAAIAAIGEAPAFIIGGAE
ncbi:MAG: dihydrofolate reductase, partial [Fluviibacter sp.]